MVVPCSVGNCILSYHCLRCSISGIWGNILIALTGAGLHECAPLFSTCSGFPISAMLLLSCLFVLPSPCFSFLASKCFWDGVRGMYPRSHVCNYHSGRPNYCLWIHAAESNCQLGPMIAFPQDVSLHFLGGGVAVVGSESFQAGRNITIWYTAQLESPKPRLSQQKFIQEAVTLPVPCSGTGAGVFTARVVSTPC